MRLNWVNRLIVTFVALIVSAALLSAERLSHAQTSEHASLAGQLLVASPSIRDPRFDHAVILMVRHDQSGAMGIVINMPAEKRRLADILKMLGANDTDVKGNVQIFSGGPVQPGTGFVVHSSDYRGPGTIDVDKNVRVTATIQILQDIGSNKGPSKSIVAFGYAGWAAGQLEDELRRGIWFAIPGDPKLIFDEDRDKVWNSAYARRTEDL
jgi:putative transcriptional regulator